MENLSLVDVSILTKGVREPSLSFFSKRTPKVGTVVFVPFRNKRLPALVVGVRGVKQAKSAIKEAPFSLKKISIHESKRIFSDPFIRTVFRLADLYVTSSGEVINALFPTRLAPYIGDLVSPKNATRINDKKHKRRMDCIQAGLSERIARYRAVIEKTFTSQRSVLILAPTRERARRVADELAAHLDPESVVEFSSRFSTKKLISKWNYVAKATNSLVAVVTPSFLSAPLPKAGCYIVEGESDSFRGLSRPFLDAKQVLREMSEETNIDIFFGAVCITAETYQMCNKTPKKIDSVAFDNTLEMVDMKPPSDSKRPFEILSESLISRIEELKTEETTLFLFVARRGLFPSTVCSDCQSVLTCPKCGAGLVLHENKKKERSFLCHRCNFTSRANIVCSQCGSWRLTPLGIGADHVYEEVKKLHQNTFRITRDDVKTPAQVHKRIQTFLKTPGSILVGTDIALEPLLAENIDTVGVVSIDARFSIPSYSIEEEILKTLLSLRSFAAKHFIVQTRMRDNRVFSYVSGTQLNTFRKQELTSRKRFGYPPSKTLITLTYAGPSERVTLLKEKIDNALQDMDITLMTLPLRKKRNNKVSATTVIKSVYTPLDYPELRQKLRSLSPEISIHVNPEHLW